MRPTTSDPPGPAYPAGTGLANEFGGPWGTCLGLLFLQSLVYYSWICVEFYGGALQYPRSAHPAELVSVLSRLLDHVLAHALPTGKATLIYLGWMSWQVLLALVGPGPSAEGMLLADGRTRLVYKCNGLFAWYTTLVLAALLHVTGLFPLTELYASFGPLLTVASIFAAALAAACYVGAQGRRKERASGNVVYDFFMGAILNPRLGSFDVKFFVELRPGIMLWFFFTVAMLIRQHETHHAVTTSMALTVFYHACYVNACYKGEECVPMSIDITHEKFGWMLAWGNLVFVPFLFPLSAYYLVVSQADIAPRWALLLLALHLAGYYIFDTANSQKDYFRANGRTLRRAFPQLPWAHLEAPRSLRTARGTALLLDGWWRRARHMNYTGDLMMAWAWALTCGFGSAVAYVYPVYLTLLLLHRERRAERLNRRKYGADWDAYCRLVPYRFLPYVY
jgi:Delta24(24(1))-sterol reductase